MVVLLQLNSQKYTSMGNLSTNTVNYQTNRIKLFEMVAVKKGRASSRLFPEPTVDVYFYYKYWVNCNNQKLYHYEPTIEIY